MKSLEEALVKNRIKGVPKRQILKKVPEVPGIYVFFQSKTPIYIGKAVNLKRRVDSYFSLHLESKTAKMISLAEYVAFIKVTSELESLLLEAKLIRQYMPHFNVIAKDDKHPLYIQITKEKYPRVITARKIAESDRNLAFYGPFPSSTNVRWVLRYIRRIFPYSEHKIGKRACLYAHIGLCNPCPNEIENIKDQNLKKSLQDTYKRNIGKIKAILDGKIVSVKAGLVNEMNNLSDHEKYEDAREIRDQVARLEYITKPQVSVDSFLQNPNLYEDLRARELKEFNNILNDLGLKIENLNRIECYDIAHLAGENPTASMVCFVKGEADKSSYRHFRIRQKKGNSDVDSLKEVITRRLKHLAPETKLKTSTLDSKFWKRPDLVIVDGGKPQAGVFKAELDKFDIPVIGLAKRFETLILPMYDREVLVFSEYKLPKGASLNLVQRIRDEAHRFARRYHHKLISQKIR